MGALKKLEAAAGRLKNEIQALYLAAKHPEVHWYSRWFIFLLLAYALSPVDLIPDFLPILGYLDDLILIPLGIYLAIRLIPAPVMAQCREEAKTTRLDNKLLRWAGGLVIVLVWISILTYIAYRWLV